MIEVRDRSEANMPGFRSAGNITQNDSTTLKPLPSQLRRKTRAQFGCFEFARIPEEHRTRGPRRLTVERELTGIAAPAYAEGTKAFDVEDDAGTWRTG